MGLPIGMNYSATLEGSSLKPELCVQCDTAFVYRLHRTAAAATTAVAFVGMGAAKTEAANEARRALQQQLEWDSDPVPCPKCDCLQPSMIRGLRRAHLKPVLLAGFVAALLGLFWVLIDNDRRAHILLAGQPSPRSPWAWALLAFGLAAMGARQLLTRRWDPQTDRPPLPVRDDVLVITRDEWSELTRALSEQ